MLSDDELVEQILLGNENAAEELIKRYYTSILRYCRWHCSNLEKAEDLTQETFLRLFKNLSGYKGKKKFKAYLYTIANHLCIDESRKVEFYPHGSPAQSYPGSGCRFYQCRGCPSRRNSEWRRGASR